MTNENIIEIKKQQKNWMGKGFLFLFLMLVSLLIALLPLISEFAKINSKLFYITGFSLFAVFTLLYSINLYKACNPSNALILSARGFIDRINVGDNIEIDWTNVSAVRTLGRSNMPFLGVTLENPDIVLAKMKKSDAAEMRENIEQNLPTLLIPQNKVRINIKELKDTFAKFAREARVLERDSQQKTKNNPFSTEDVLRAFGKLPQNEEASEPEMISNDENELTKIVEDSTTPNENVEILQVTEEVVDISENNSDICDDTKFDHDEVSPLNIEIKEDTAALDIEANVSVAADDDDVKLYISEPINSENETNDNSCDVIEGANKEEINLSRATNTATEAKLSASDSFYAALRAKASAKAERAINNDGIPNININNGFNNIDDTSKKEEMSDEIQEILSRAKSSKISEIEKILSDTDIPYSLSRENPDETTTQFEESAFADDDVIDENTIGENITIDHSKDEIPPSLDNLFSNQENAEEAEINLDLRFVTNENDNINIDHNSIGESLESLINDALKSNESDQIPDDNNLGDTREFIID